MTTWNDVYHGNWPFNVTKAVVAKAGEGLSFTDDRFADFMAQAARGGHHGYAYYALHTGSVSAQAARAAKLIGKRPAMFDVEEWPKESGSAAGIASLSEVMTAVDVYRSSGGVMFVQYLPRSQWEDMGRPNLLPLQAKGIHIINADYRKGSAAANSPAFDPYGGVKPFAVQYKPCNNVSPLSWAEAEAIWEHGGQAATPAPPAPKPPTLTAYTVKAGDTLSSIASAHGMTLPALKALNPKAGHPAGNFDVIWPGDRITVRA